MSRKKCEKNESILTNGQKGCEEGQGGEGIDTLDSLDSLDTLDSLGVIKSIDLDVLTFETIGDLGFFEGFDAFGL